MVHDKVNLQQFLVSATDCQFWQKPTVHWFVYKDEDQCPASFFVQVRRMAEVHGGLPVQPLRVEQGLSVAYAQLQTSFLGSAWRYSLTCSSLDARETRELLAYAENYQGPHKLMLFVTSEQAQTIKNQTIIQLDEPVDETLCLKLASFLGYNLSLAAQRMLRRIFKEQPRISLASALMIIEYTLLAGASLVSTGASLSETSSVGISSTGVPLAGTLSADIQDVLTSFDPERIRQNAMQDTLVEDALLEQIRGMLKSESSLFTLSQLFFAKQPEAFYRYLATIQSMYPEQFWISFWSEQLYRAFFYVTYMKKGNQSEAQKIGARLPFSFLQRDWRKHESAALASSHAFLYELDSALKNSRGELGFDRFYHNFFKGNA